MKRVVMRDEHGVYAFVREGLKVRPGGTTALDVGTKVYVELVGKLPAWRAKVWNCDKPRQRTEETWSDGSRLSLHEIVLCARVRKGGQTCPASDVSVREWCGSCLRATPFDVEQPNKPWRGMTDRERAMLVADVARSADHVLTAVGERYLAMGDVVSRMSVVDHSNDLRRQVEEFFTKQVHAKADVVEATDAVRARTYVEVSHGVDSWQVITVRRHHTAGKWLVRFIKGGFSS